MLLLLMKIHENGASCASINCELKALILIRHAAFYRTLFKLDFSFLFRLKMGAYKYMSELYRKKQSDVMRYLLRIRCWQYRQLTKVVGLEKKASSKVYLGAPCA